MRIRCQGLGVAAIFLIATDAAQASIVDDVDPGIEYHGTWVHNHIQDSKDLHGGSVTFTNASGSTVTYRFSGELDMGDTE